MKKTSSAPWSSAWLVALLVALAFTACATEPSAEAPGQAEAPSQEASAAETATEATPRAKFEPPDGSILVFAGQSNDAVGGHDEHRSGYVDHFGTPAGFSHYVGFLEDVDTPLGYRMDAGRIEGLTTWDYWGAGPMCLECYLKEPAFEKTVVHLALSMEGGSCERLANGAATNEDEPNLDELAAFMQKYSHFAFLLRPGYEFDGEWNGYPAAEYKIAFRRIIDHLRAAEVTNFATVFASSKPNLPRETWEAYYPGDEYVDWLGYSWWAPAREEDAEEGAPELPSVAAELAREWQKPILMAEVGPRHYRTGKDETEKVWAWYASLFEHIEEYSDVVKGLAIINNHWDPEPMWKDGDWGDFRLENDPVIAERWREKVMSAPFVHTTEGTYELIGFSSE